MALWPGGHTKLINKSQPQVRWDFLFEAAGPGCTYVMRIPLVMAVQKALLSEWEMVQKISLHDWFVYAFARANCYVWIIDSRPGMLYRQHDSNQVGVNVGWRAHMRRLSKIRGHFGLSQSRLIANIAGLADDPFVKMWSTGGRIGQIRLGLKAAECRRSLRDKIAFAFLCLIIK
jgi:rhamnosyltransferase